ncbi:MAG: uroporphyrinogen decarboxylase family protein [Verrucomicrobiota bacterium]
MNSSLPTSTAEPNFDNLLSVLQRQRPSRPTLFEFYLNQPLYSRVAGPVTDAPADLADQVHTIRAHAALGYDYTVVFPPFGFGSTHEKLETCSLNESIIPDRAAFEAFTWPDPDALDYSWLDRLQKFLPGNMKLIVCGPCGVLENAIGLVGYESLCFMILDDEQLVFDLFGRIGTVLCAYYRQCLKHESVGAIIGNDDWGFKSQTMLSPADMRRFVFPWHRRIVKAAHEAGRPAILHSCGNLELVMDDVIDDIKYDGKHSYEDTIQPVEEAYDIYHKRIAILGGIDMDFMCRATPDEVYQRSKAMLERAATDGAFALGTGNSVPEYVPDENYFAMIQAVNENR